MHESLDLLMEEGCVILIANFSRHTNRPSYRGAMLLKRTKKELPKDVVIILLTIVYEILRKKFKNKMNLILIEV